MKRLSSIFSLLTIAVAMSAQTVSLETAQSKAAALLSKTTSAKGGAQSANVTLAYTAQSGDETYYYVFNSPDGGFVIIGGDEAAREVLGYSENGSFDYDKLPENMKWWLGQYTQQISAAIKGVKDGSLVLDKSTAAKGASVMAARSSVGPLVLTQWNQGAKTTAGDAYNSELPVLGVGYPRLVTGCVATAGAQIMKYWNYPTQGMGSKSYTKTWGSPVGTKTFEANFGNTTYDWANMLNTYDGSESAAQKQAVGTLMYHVGVAANMNYGQSESSADEVNLAEGMIRYFGYDKGMSLQCRNYYATDQAWEDMIYEELSADRPILYSGQSTNGGHAFVVDGYNASTSKFHINWGWGGYCDGDYPLTGSGALKPGGSGTGGGGVDAAYTSGQRAIIGIQPNAGNRLVKNMHCTEYGIGDYSTKSASATAGTRITLNVQPKYYITDAYGFFNGSLMATNLEVGAMFVNKSTSAVVCVKDVDISWNNIAVNSGKSPIYAWIPVDMPAGDYYVYPAFKDENGNWQKMEMSAQTIPTLTVTAPSSGLYVLSGPAIADKYDGKSYIGKDGFGLHGKVTATIWNNTGSAINNGDLTFYVFPNTGGSVSSVGSISQTITLANGEKKDIELDMADYSGSTLTVGSSYFAQFLYGGWLNPQVTFYVVGMNNISYTLTSAGWGTICLPFTADVPSGMTAYEVTGNVGGSLVMNSVSKLEMNKPYLVTGTAGTYNFSGPSTPEGQYTNGLLVGNTASGTVYAPKDSYVLQNLSSGVGFYKVANNNSQTCGQYKAYLTKSPALGSLPFFLLDGATAVDNAEATEQQGSTVMKVMKDGKLTIIKDGKAYNAIGIMQPAF